MEKYLKTKAIVLKRSNYKETDRLITLYTEEKGKITVIAKGVRKITSNKRGHLELLNLINMQAVDHKGWHILTQAESIKTHSKIKEDLTLTSYAYYISEIFEKLIPEDESNELLFKLLAKTLDYLDESQKLTWVNAFNIKLLRMLGFYSRSEIKSLAPEIVGYLNKLEMNVYEEISLSDFEDKIEQTAHAFLRNFTENVLEREIKTKFNLKKPTDF